MFSHRARNWVRHDTRGMVGNLVASNACLDGIINNRGWSCFRRNKQTIQILRLGVFCTGGPEDDYFEPA